MNRNKSVTETKIWVRSQTGVHSLRRAATVAEFERLVPFGHMRRSVVLESELRRMRDPRGITPDYIERFTEIVDRLLGGAKIWRRSRG
jgi:hypothetical protein